MLGLSRRLLHRGEYRLSLKSHTQTHFLIALPLQVGELPENRFIKGELTHDKLRVLKDYG